MRSPSAFTVLTAAILLIAGVPHAMAGLPVHDVLFASTQGGAIYRSDSAGAWREADTGMPSGVDVTALAVAPGTAGTVYAGTDGSGVYVTTDNGQVWQSANGSEYTLGGAQIRGLAVDPRDGHRVYAATGDGEIYTSSDTGQSWVGHPLPIGSAITCLAIDVGRPSMLFAGTSGDGVLISRDGGISWSSPIEGTPPDVAINALASDPGNGDVIYAATADGMYQTIDGGVTWQAERRGIPYGTDLRAVAVDPHNGAQAVAGGADGVFYHSSDGGTSWQAGSVTTGSQITALLFDPARLHRMLAGTAGAPAPWTSANGGGDWAQEGPIGEMPGSGIVCLAAAMRPALPTAAVRPPLGTMQGLRYFAETGHIVQGAFLSFYDRYGGLKIFGLPLSEAFVEDGHIVQYFERARMVRQGAGVAISPLGSWLTAGRRFHTVAPFRNGPTHVYFPATHHSLAGAFLAYWQQHHGALLFGAPISEPLREQNGDGTGRTYLVQYFQRARMEYHPELSGTRFEVTLGLLGTQYLQRHGP